MKAILTFVAWATVTTAILFAALNPVGGVIYRNPLSCVGLGLIGLGIFIDVRKAALKARLAAEKA